jgi:hypothetical protein
MQADTVIAACVRVVSAEITFSHALDDPAAYAEIPREVVALGGSC